MAGTTINRGDVLITRIVSVSLTPASVNANSTAEQTFTVTGLNPTTDQISALELSSAGWTTQTSIVNVRVSAANTLGISFQNNTAGALTPPSGTYLIEVNRVENFPFATNLA